MTTMFLEDDEVAVLTGRKFKSLQVDQLRRMGIPFFVNALGRAVVARAAIEGAAWRRRQPRQQNSPGFRRC